jgi:hypothetical protein
MPFKTPCPHCGATCKLTDQARGKRVRCGGCSETFVVPGRSDEGYVGEDDRPARKPGPGIRRERSLEPPVKAVARSRRQRDEEDEDDYEEDTPRRRKAAGRMSPVVLGSIIGGGVLALLLGLGLVLWLGGKGEESTEPKPTPIAGNPIQPGPGQGNPPRGNRPGQPGQPGGGNPPRPGPARAVWKVVVDPAPGGQPLAEIPNLALPVKVGNDVLFPTSPSPFVAIGQNSGTRDSRVLYDLRTGQPAGTLRGKLGGFFKSAISPDGEYLAAIPSGSLQAVDIWSFRTGKKVGHINTGIKGFVDLMDFAGPGQIVTIGTGNQLKKTVRVWDIRTGQVVREIQRTKPVYGREYAFSPGRRYLALFTDKAIHAFDLKNGGENELDVLGATSGSCEGIAFSPDGTLLALCLKSGSKGRILAVDVTAGKVVADHKYPQSLKRMVRSASRHKGPALEWLPDNSGWLVHGDTVLDRATGKPRFSVAEAGIKRQTGPGRVLSKTKLLVLASGQGLTTVSFEGKAGGGEPVAGGPRPATAADWSGARALRPGAGTNGPLQPDPLGSARGPLRIPLSLDAAAPAPGSRTRSGGPVRILFTRPEVGQVVTVTQVSPASKFVPRTWRADRYDLLTGKALGSIDAIAQTPQTRSVTSFGLAEVSPEGTRLLVRDMQKDSRLDVWSLEEGKHLAGWLPYEKEKQQQVVWADFGDAGHAWTMSIGGKLVLWALPGCKALATLDATRGTPALSPGGKYVAIGAGNGIDILDALTGEARGRLDLPAGVMSPSSLSLAWRQDGKELAGVMTTSDGTSFRPVVARWDLTTGKEAGHFALRRASGLQTVRYCSADHLLLGGSNLLDLNAKQIFLSYAGMIATGTPDGKAWFTVRGTDGYLLVASTLPDRNGRTLTAQLKAAAPLITLGTTVAIQVEANGTVADLPRIREGITDIATRQVKANGLEPAANGQLRLVLQVQESGTGDSLELEIFGARREKIRVPVKKLTCVATLTDSRGGGVLWTNKQEQTTRSLVGLRTIRGDPAESLLRGLWEFPATWAGGLPLPGEVVRVGARVVALPVPTPLTPGP